MDNMFQDGSMECSLFSKGRDVGLNEHSLLSPSTDESVIEESKLL